jgi:hypothetical protein
LVNVLDRSSGETEWLRTVSLHTLRKTGSLHFAMPQILLGLSKGLGVACVCFGFGCGPNVQMIYEGNVRFEHCYRLDMDPTIAPTHRRACWQDWLTRHTYAQSGDRLSHAQQRLNDLDRGDQSTLTLSVDAGNGGPLAGSLPLPMNIHDAPPPRAIEPVPTPSQLPKQSVGPPTPAPPGAECSDECRVHWEACAQSCVNHDDALLSGVQSAAKLPTDVTVPASQKKDLKYECLNCRRQLKACMRRCYK